MLSYLLNDNYYDNVLTMTLTTTNIKDTFFKFLKKRNVSSVLSV